MRRIHSLPIRSQYNGISKLRYSFILGSYNNKKDELSDQRFVCFISKLLDESHFRMFLNDADEFAAYNLPILFTKKLTSGGYYIPHNFQRYPLSRLSKKYAGSLTETFNLLQNDWYAPRDVYTTSVIIQKTETDTDIGTVKKENIVYTNILSLRTPIINV